MTEAIPDPVPVGAIHDTNSRGRFDLVIYQDGILAVKGTYIGVALRGAGVGMVGAGGGGLGGAASAGGGAAVGALGGRSYEGKRIEKLLRHPREEVVASNPANFFLPRKEIIGVVLRKRWHGCSATIKTEGDHDGRTFTWKPSLNNFSHVRRVMESAFGDQVTSE
jgi:hypothetical protein